MSSENVPCKNPKRCGVKSHRPGTQASCQQISGALPGTASANLSATPKLGSDTSTVKVPLSAEGEAMLKKAVSGKEQEVVLKNVNGTEMILALNIDKVKGSLFRNTDLPVYATIRTADGRKVYCMNYGGGDSVMKFKDGQERTTSVIPVDEELDDLSPLITSAEFDVLEQGYERAWELGYIDNVDPNHDMSNDERDREAVRRVLEARDEIATSES